MLVLESILQKEKLVNNKNYTVLFVEDEENIRKNYAGYLKTYFKEVYEAENAEDALVIYEKEHPDIMIVDIHLPKMSGLELIKEIRKNDVKVKIIILTAHDDAAFLFEAIPLKLTKYLVKPINRKELKDSLALAIRDLEEFTVMHNKNIQLEDKYSWDRECKELYHCNEVVVLTIMEKKFLELLFSGKSRFFTYDEIFDYVWGYDEMGSINGLKNLVSRLRKKLPEDMIINMFNEGYKIKF